MSGKKHKPTRTYFSLIFFLLFINLTLGAFSILTQTVWKIEQSFYISVGIIIATILVLIKIITLAKKTLKKMPNSDLVDQTSVIIESIGEGLITINEKSNISLINPEAKDISGWSDDAVDMNYQAILQLVDATGQTIDDAINPISLAQKSGKAQTSREFFLKTMGGKTIPLHLQVSPLTNSASLVVAFRNISLELEKERQQLEFISTASHEMRTPVAAIDGYLDLIINPKICKIDAKAFDYATKAKSSSKHLGDLFKNLLDISKVEDGRLRANLEAINVTEFVKKLSSNLLPLAEAKQLKMVILPDINYRGEIRLQQSLFVQADQQMLTESVTNLIENAIKYTKSGKIKIDVEPNRQNEVVISVNDSGIGIPKEDLPHLFQKFYRVDNRDTREINGTGLGLYLTRRMIEHMHGRVWVESELGKGSTFFIAMTRLDQKQIKQLLNAKQVQPERQTDKSDDFIKSLTESSDNEITEQSVLRLEQPVTGTTTAAGSKQRSSNTGRVLSRESAEKLRQLGYNTTDFTIAENILRENLSDKDKT